MRTSRNMSRLCLSLCALFILGTGSAAEPAGGKLAAQTSFDIPSQPLGSALKQLANQAGIQILFEERVVRGHEAPAVKARQSALQTLTTLLSNTDLEFTAKDETVAVRKKMPPLSSREEREAPRSILLARAAEGDERANTAEESPPRPSEDGIPEILVRGSKSLNMDIRRTRDDIQPYVTFDRAAIEQSAAVNLEDFLKQRLTMNTSAQSNGQVPSLLGNNSSVNMRGMGTNQTLILIDGHRTAGAVYQGIPQQPDLNGIPMAAVERIEVLPTTASGIYGGSATGGVVNVVLRRDYSGLDSKVSYENTFDSDSAIRRVDISGGFSLEEGRTDVLLTGSYSDANQLTARDRDFTKRGRALIIANNGIGGLSSSSPPSGATTNIRSVNGSPLFGAGTPSFTSVPAGYAGGGGLAPLQANAGRYNLDLANTAKSNGGGNAGLLNTPKVESMTATVRRQFSDRFQAFLELGAVNNSSYLPSNSMTESFTISATAPNNPFGQAISVTTPALGADGALISTNYSRRAVGGVILKLARGWQGELDYTWNRTRFFTSNPGFSTGSETGSINTGVIDVLRDTNVYPINFSAFAGPSFVNFPTHGLLKDATLRAAGPLGSLPAGPLTVSALIEHRDESLDDAYTFTTPGSQQLVPSRFQTVDSLYLEIKVPLISGANALAGVRELELQLAGRRDDYEIISSNTINLLAPTPVVRTKNKSVSTDPTVGLRYRPVQDVMLRASYGTGFLPPVISLLAPSLPSTSAAGAFIDPRRGGAPTAALQILNGGNPNLQPEESQSWSMGVVLTPRFLSGLRLSVDYTRIDKSDNIAGIPGGSQGLINNEALFPQRVTRSAPAQGDPFGVGPITTLDQTVINISRSQAEAYDVSVDYRQDTAGLGAFDFFALATWQTHYQTQLLPNSPIVENVGIGSGSSNGIPLKFKANAGVVWRKDRWTAGWTARYFDSYAVISAVANQGNGGRVSAQTYHDMFAGHRFVFDDGAFLGAGLLNGVEMRAGVKNVFNTEPPFDAAVSSGLYSLYGDPRLATYYISLQRSF